MAEEAGKKKCVECNLDRDLIRKKYNAKQCCCSCTPAKYDYIEGVVCKNDEIEENGMKVFPLGEDGGKVLLIKQKGQIHALGTKCTHYGAPLHTGALADGRIRCPWHGACFNIETGDIEDYPGLDSLPCHKVTVDEAGLVTVRAKRTDLELNRRTKEMCPYDPENAETVIIVGGGPAGATCAESLRQEGFTGNIIMVCKEEALPYDRVKCSKKLDFEVDNALLRPQLFYTQHNIEIRFGVEATGLVTQEKILELSNYEDLKYDYLFLCTGSRPRVPDLPGVDLDNIFVLRTFEDANDIHSLLFPDMHVVILGLGFIGLEVASYCVDKCASVTIVGRGTAPLRPVFGEEIGNRIKQELEAKGVKFIFNSGITQFIPSRDDDFLLHEVEFTDGTVVRADIAVLGIGTTYFTNFVKECPVEMLENGTIVVDKYLKTSEDKIYAGGDIAYAPILGSDDNRAAIGHYGLAHYHGKIAALNICGKRTPLNAIPFFWTNILGKNFRYAGYGAADNIRIYGSLENLEFFAFHLREGKVIAMSSSGTDPIVAEFANFLYAGKTLTEQDIEKDPLVWMEKIPKELIKKFPRGSRTVSVSETIT